MNIAYTSYNKLLPWSRTLYFVSGICSGDFLAHSLGTVADLACREIVKNIFIIEDITEHSPSITTWFVYTYCILIHWGGKFFTLNFPTIFRIIPCSLPKNTPLGCQFTWHTINICIHPLNFYYLSNSIYRQVEYCLSCAFFGFKSSIYCKSFLFEYLFP